MYIIQMCPCARCFDFSCDHSMGESVVVDYSAWQGALTSFLRFGAYHRHDESMRQRAKRAQHFGTQTERVSIPHFIRFDSTRRYNPQQHVQWVARRIAMGDRPNEERSQCTRASQAEE